MHKFSTRSLLLATLTLIVALPAVAGTALVSNTTLSAETSSNTSIGATWAGATDGNIGPANISKVDTRALLYSGATAKIYAHFMPWFGGSNHMNVGYRSDDTVQVKRQVTDMMSRGIQGAIVDWYGPNYTRENTTTLYMMREAELRGGNFEFAVMEDVGALKKCANTSGCDVTQNLINDLNYAYNNYEQSSAYMRSSGQPVVFFFGVEAYTIDWTRVRANVLGNPLFVQRNSGAFSKTQWNGAYGWLASGMVTSTDPMALKYLDDFYWNANNYPAKIPFGSGYKGFDGSLSSWSTTKYIGQYCGQTWLKSVAEAGKYYSSSKQLAAVQLVTWNDYEEGTSLETGVDNCVTVSAGMSGSTLNWSFTGDATTIDHFSLFISQDGTNLMKIGDVPLAQSSLDMAPFGFAPASYTLLVKAVGKPSMTNHMSAGVSFTLADLAPTVVLAVTPATGVGVLHVTATATVADADGSIAGTSIDFGDGLTAQGTSASHTYSAPGTYTVRATTTDNLGATAVASQAVTLNTNTPPSVTLSVTPNSGIGPVIATASIVATDVDGTISNTMIDFGDGASSTSASATHAYSVPGSYTVTATATDNLGASASQSQTVTVKANQAPLASLSITPASAVVPFTLTASTAASTDADGSIASAVIDFGDGTSVTGSSATHVYSVAGTFTVRATVTDNLGASSTASASVTAAAPIPSTVTISTPTSGSTVTSPVRIAATGTAATAVSSMQIYVDGVLRYQASGSSVDTALSMLSGSRNVVVEGWDSNGKSFTASTSINVLANQSPVAKLSVTPTSGSGPLTVQASAVASYDPDGSINQVSINFGDGTTIMAASGSHIYSAAGSYTVTATVWDNIGASSSTSTTVTVSAPTPKVTLTSPTAGSKTSKQVHVTASGYSPATMKTMEVYVDGKSAYQVNSTTVDTYLALSLGGHKILVQGWDGAGVVTKSALVNFNVVSSSTSTLSGK